MEELEQSLAVLRATLDATAGGILALDVDGRLTAFNRRFAKLWRSPDSMVIEAGQEEELWALHRDQVGDPAAFDAEMARVAKHPETNSFDVIEFKDGRVFERYSQPERIAVRTIGRVWSFRDTTARTNAERALRRRTRRLEIQNDALRRLTRRRIKDLADRQASFAQIEEALTREYGGTGLGLAVVERLTQCLGGDVSVESEPGVCSTFVVRLQATPDQTRQVA